MEKVQMLYQKHKEVIHYLIVGGLTTFVSLGSYYLLVLTILDPGSALQLQCANLISWIVAVTFAYITNRRYVFESQNEHLLREAAAFFCSRVTTLLLEMAGMFLLVTWLGCNDKMSKLLMQAVIMISNYVLSKYIVFRKRILEKRITEDGSGRDGSLRYWFWYTVIFACLTLAVFSFFLLSGRTLVKRLDAWTQHYKALIYYSRWLRAIGANLVSGHSFALPAYSFSMGYGADLLTSLHYYVVGDPLNLLSALVPVRYMYHLYGALAILRLYLAGVSFSCYGHYMGREKNGTLAGTFVYVFCGFSLCYSVINPYFVNPLIYFPLLLKGIEKIIREKKPGLFIGMVFVSAVSNFYFFYTLALFTALYAVLRLLMVYGRSGWKHAVLRLSGLAGYAVTGVLLSAFLLLPVLIAFSDSPRVGVAEYDFWPSLTYLRNLPGALLTYTEPGMWTSAGYSAVTLVVVLFLFMRRGNRHLKGLFALLTMFLIFPVFGHIFNGLSYVSNRWIWVYSMLIAYITAVLWPALKNVSRRESLLLLAGTCIYFGVCVLLSGVSRNLFVSGCVAVLFTAVLFLSCLERFPWRHLTEMMLFCLVLAGIYGNAYCYFSEHSRNIVSQFKRQETINEELYDIVDQAVLSADDPEEMYRYSGHAYDVNSAVLSDLANVDYYWSLSPGSFFGWWTQLAQLENTHDYYHTMDDRTMLNTLSGVKYFVTEAGDGQEAYVPYGYQEIGIRDEKAASRYRLFQNEYTLPLGYAYEHSIRKEDFDALTPLERQEALMQGAVLEEPAVSCRQTEPVLTSERIDHVLEYEEDEILQQDDTFIVRKENAVLTLQFDGMEQAETYLYLDGLDYRKEELSLHDILYQTEPDTLEMDFYAEDKDGSTVQKHLTYRTEKEMYTTGRHDFLVNLGYSETGKKTAAIIFPETGVYTFDGLEILCQPMDRYAEQAKTLGGQVLEHVDMHRLEVEDAPFVTSMVTGDIKMKDSGILCVTIPYSSGWRAWVDDTEQPLLHTNVMFMGLELEPGEHRIRLVYETPGLRTGAVLSIVSLAGILLSMAVRKKKL